MSGFEPNVPTALDTYLTPTAVAPCGQFATAVLAEAKAGNKTISDHSIPGAAFLQGLQASRLSFAQSQSMRPAASSAAKDPAFLYATEWQAVQCSEPPAKSAISRKFILWDIGGQKGRRVASKKEFAQLSATRGLQLLQGRALSENLRLSLPYYSPADTGDESSAASAALMKVAATEQPGSLQSVKYVDSNSRAVYADFKASGDAFGMMSAAGLQLFPKLLAERTQPVTAETFSSQANSAVISGGLGGMT